MTQTFSNAVAMLPSELSTHRIELAAEYMKDTERMGLLESLYAGEWMVLRTKAKTDKEANMMFDASELGKEMLVLKWKLRGVDKMLSAIASKIRILEGESRNQF